MHRPYLRAGYRTWRWGCAVMAAPFDWLWCTVSGVRWRWGWVLCGYPRFRAAGGRIRIGERLTARSRSRGNAIGVFQPVILTAWGAGSEIILGDDVGLSGCSIVAQRRIEIGSRVLVGAGALIIDTDAHPLSPEGRKGRLPANAAPIAIGDDVFIGARAIILKGVTIGAGCVVGAGAVVTRDVPSRSIVAGNPARKVGTV